LKTNQLFLNPIIK